MAAAGRDGLVRLIDPRAPAGGVVAEWRAHGGGGGAVSVRFGADETSVPRAARPARRRPPLGYARMLRVRARSFDV